VLGEAVEAGKDVMVLVVFGVPNIRGRRPGRGEAAMWRSLAFFFSAYSAAAARIVWPAGLDHERREIE